MKKTVLLLVDFIKRRKNNGIIFSFIGVLFFMATLFPIWNIYGEHFYSGSEEIILIDSEYKTLADLLNHQDFKNKVIFVDVWGTGCAPCIRQFGYKNDIENRFQKDSVAYLFIAYKYNKANDIRKWKSMIRKYDLKGHHFFLNWDFFYDMRRMLDGGDDNAPFAIPRYFIVGRDKEIVYSDANWPSEGELLFSQIDSVLMR